MLAQRNVWQAGLLAGRSPFDKPVLSQVEGLRANGRGLEIINNFPFMLSLSKHENHFFSLLLGLGLFFIGAMFPLPLWGGTTLATPTAVGTTSGGDAMFLILGSDHRIWYTIFDENSSLAASTAGYAGFSTTLNEKNPFAIVTEGTVNDGFVDPSTFPATAVAGFIWQPVPGTKTFQDEPHVVRTNEGDLVIFALGTDDKIWYTYFDLDSSSQANEVISEAPFSSNSDNPFATAKEGSDDNGWVDPNTFPAGIGNDGIWAPLPGGDTWASSPDVIIGPTTADLFLAVRGTDDQPFYTIFDLNDNGNFGNTGNTANPFSTSSLEGSVDDGWPDTTVGAFASASGRVGIWLPLPTGKTISAPVLVNTTNGSDVMFLLLGSDNKIWYTFFDENSSIAADAKGFAGFGTGNNASNPFASATEGSSNDGFPDPDTFPVASATGLAWLPFGGGMFSDGPRVVRTTQGDLIVATLGQDSRIWYTYFDLDGSSGTNVVISEAPFSSNTDNPFARATEGSTVDGFVDSGTFQVGDGAVDIWVPVPNVGGFASSPALLIGTSNDLLFIPRGLDDRIWYTYFDLDDSGGFGGGNANNSFTGTAEGTTDDGWVDPLTHLADSNHIGIWLAMPN